MRGRLEVKNGEGITPGYLFTDDDLYLFNQGRHFRLYEKMGAHPGILDGTKGVFFAVWAPDAEAVYVMGDFNYWKKEDIAMCPVRSSGIWEVFVPHAEVGAHYKYHVMSRFHGYRADKADPFAFLAETPPMTASIVWDLTYQWKDQGWMSERGRRSQADSALAIYEVHLGSWMRDGAGRPLSYLETAERLPRYVKEMGFTHVEFLPVMEHPFYGSWGYQTTGYFAPTSRYGSPQDFMYLVDSLHREGIGVILDWVPSHFPTDEHGLGYFDGTHLYEHADERKGIHPDWKSFIFNYGRNEVRSFLISSALFWLDLYHADGIRVDAVASMLYLDYSRKDGEWIPNDYGGRENLDAISFLRTMNEEIYRNYPDTCTIAEESTAWPMVSRPTYLGGLGFGMKWDMGWMHDTLSYFSKDPIYRKFHHRALTFRMLYAFHENFILPLSHDEVVHGKGSLPAKMPGDDWQRFANLRAMFSYMYAQPGKKHLFMGMEFGQWKEWNHEEGLEWHLLGSPLHDGLQLLIRDLNGLYAREKALHDCEFHPSCFEWVDCSDTMQSVVSLLRRSNDKQHLVVAVFNLTPIPRLGYRVGVPMAGRWNEILNSDASSYGGSGMGNLGGVASQPEGFHGRPHSISITLPPLAALFFKWERGPA
jgi:1,4-alpha-glucan branching enzyme